MTPIKLMALILFQRKHMDQFSEGSMRLWKTDMFVDIDHHLNMIKKLGIVGNNYQVMACANKIGWDRILCEK